MFKWVCVLVGLLLFPCFYVSAATSDLVINEVLPNPAGDDTQNEFIEIYNQGLVEEDLTGLYLDDAEGGSAAYLFPADTKISAGGYLAFYSKDTKLGLTNSGERARILNSDKTVLTEIIFGESTEGSSYARKTDGTYEWTNNLTPNAENIFIVATPTPTPTSDPTPTPTATPVATPTPTSTATPDYSMAKNLVVNELLPDPSGNDGENEFIEIFNPGSVAVDLSGFYVDDTEGGSTPHKIADGTTIEAGGYLVFYSRDSKITLNNTSNDSARLLYPDKAVLSSISYDKSSHEDYSYARKTDGSFAWTSEPTPGEENEFVTPTEEPEATATPKPTATPKATATPKPTKAPKPTATPKGSVKAIDSQTTKNYTVRRANGKVLAASSVAKTVAIADLNKEKIGTLVTTKGNVSLLPGTFDSRLMYLAGSGVGIFLASGNYPSLELGDVVSVTGFLTKPGRELFVSVRSGDDIAQEDSGALPDSHLIGFNDLDDSKIGWLVKMEGVVTKNETNSFEFGTDGKTIKILLGASKTDLKIGDNVSIVGVLAADKNGLRIFASEVNKLGGGEQKTANSSWLLLFIRRWKTSVGVVCFGCALLLAVLIYYPKVSTLRTVPKILKN